MSNLVQSIINAPRSIKGLKPLAYWAFREDVKLTFDGNKVTVVTAPILGVISGVKFFMNAGGEQVVSEDNFNGFKHKFTAVINDGGEVLDGMDDIVLFVEANDGTKYVLGAKYGLWKTTQASMANDNLSTTAVEFTSREGMEETSGDYYLVADITGIITTYTYEVISGLQIAKGGVIKLTVDSDKTGYVVAPDKSVITSTSGVINTTWTGIAGNAKIITPKNTSFLDITGSGFIGELKSYFMSSFVADNCDSLTGISLFAQNAHYFDCHGSDSIKNIYAPMATVIYANDCSLTANSIGDFLFAAAQNNPAVAGIAKFSGGTNAGIVAVSQYMSNDPTDNGNWLSDFIRYNLPNWTITLNP
jgi:hypothetical protein